MSQIKSRQTNTDKTKLDMDVQITGSVLEKDYKTGLDVNLACVGGLITSIDVDSGSPTTITYVGKAPPGTATSAAKWQVKRIQVSGTATHIRYADGDPLLDNIWNNRESLSYS